MSEEQTTPQTEATATASDTNSGIQPEELSIIDKANNARQSLENQLKAAAEVEARLTKLFTQLALGGKSNAGTPQKTQEQTEKEAIDAEVKRNLGLYR